MRAVVLYKDNQPGILLRIFLKPGFRHCAMLLDDSRYWIAFDHGRGQPLVTVVALADFDIAGHYRGKPGYHVQEVEFDRQGMLAGGLGPHNCVTSIKRLLGIRAFRVQTPYRLYRHLEKRHA